jgi:carbonic anhydrase
LGINAQRILPTMSHLDTLLQRNKSFAAEKTAAGTLMPSLPRSFPLVKAVIIGCADMRVDPANVLGLETGEAVVMQHRRQSHTGLLEQLGSLGRIGQVAQEIPGGGGEFHLIVLHHTDCGITRLAHDTDLLTHYFQIGENALPAKAVLDPREAVAVAVDVDALRAIPELPAAWLLSGLVYGWLPVWSKPSSRPHRSAAHRNLSNANRARRITSEKPHISTNRWLDE